MVKPVITPVHDICTQVQEDSLALLSSELTDERERQVLIHLATCQHCREEFRKDRMMMRMLPACPTITASPDFTEKLAKRLSSENILNPNHSQIEIANERSDITPTPAKQKSKQSKPKDAHRKPI